MLDTKIKLGAMSAAPGPAHLSSMILISFMHVYMCVALYISLAPPVCGYSRTERPEDVDLDQDLSCSLMQESASGDDADCDGNNYSSRVCMMLAMWLNTIMTVRLMSLQMSPCVSQDFPVKVDVANCAQVRH